MPTWCIEQCCVDSTINVTRLINVHKNEIILKIMNDEPSSKAPL